MFIRGAIATYPGEERRVCGAEEQKRRVAKVGARAISIGSSGLGKRVVLV